MKREKKIHFLHPDYAGIPFIIAKTSCGRDVDSVRDFDTRLEYVTCRLCNENFYKRNRF